MKMGWGVTPQGTRKQGALLKHRVTRYVAQGHKNSDVTPRKGRIREQKVTSLRVFPRRREGFDRASAQDFFVKQLPVGTLA